MNYTVNDLLSGAKIMASKVFGQKREYHLQFNKEEDGCWYVDFPGWPFDHYNLMMVAGADKLCELLSDGGNTVQVTVVPNNKPQKMPGHFCLVQMNSSITGGADYHVECFPQYRGNVWLCPVTLFVFGKYPKYIYIKKTNE